MRILITGASGFIGSFAVEKALSLGYEVWAGVRSTSSKDYLADKRINFIDLPYADQAQLKEAIGQFKAERQGAWDAVVHIMGLTKCKQPDDFERVNYGYTKNLADALIAADAVPKTFVYMSSLSAMGPGNEETLAPIGYDDPMQPNTLYGKSKLKAEQYLRQLPDLPLVVLRPTGVYGPREKDYFVMLQTLSRHINPAIGFKEQYITFIYVKDLVDIIFTCIGRGLKGRTYLVADGDVWTGTQYADLAARLLGVKLLLPLRVPCFLVKGICRVMDWMGRKMGFMPTLNNDKYNILSARNWKCDTQRLNDELGFRAAYNLEKGLEECIAWYRKNGWL